MRRGKALVALTLIAALAGFGGWAMSAGAKTKVHAKPAIPASVPFGSHVTVGCDVTHGVQTYVSDTRVALAVVQNGCTGPDIQNRIKVRVDNARGVILYQLHHDANGTGPIMDVDAVPLAVWAT